MLDEVDILVVGAGLAGLVTAERMASQHGLRSLVVEKRSHIGGNCYDEINDAGVLIHKYGPHYFRTNSVRVKNYLSQFTDWLPTDYQVLSYSGAAYWQFPINLNTYEQLTGHPASEQEFQAYLEKVRVPIKNPANSEEVIISQVGWDLYEKFFLGYTLKQWQKHPRELDPSICARIPIRTNRDNRYLRESFQAMPASGYSAMFQRMMDVCDGKVSVLLNTHYKEVLQEIRCRHVVYTGSLDAYFDYRLGQLPYRSLRFEEESFSNEQLQSRETISKKPGFWQPAMQVNYPGAEDFTRIVEIKHATQQVCANTTIVREYPQAYELGKEAFYPVMDGAGPPLSQQYRDLARQESHVTFLGRLAEYRYYNMDQVIDVALQQTDSLAKRLAL